MALDGANGRMGEWANGPGPEGPGYQWSAPSGRTDMAGFADWGRWLRGRLVDLFGVGFVCMGVKFLDRIERIAGGHLQGGPRVTISRFTWEGLQTVVGAGAAAFAAVFLHVDGVEHYGGTTVIRCWRKDRYWGGVCFGSVILGDCRIAAVPGNALFMHEYGHSLQSRASGPIYLFRYGLPSVVSRHGKGQHDQHPVERDANLRAFRHFGN